MPKFDLVFKTPLMNAAGMLGFAPDPHGMLDLRRLGAFITDPLSPERRTPAQGRRFISYPGGFLVHTGYPNPGLRAALRRYAPRWKTSQLPVLVHLLAQSVGELQEMLPALEALEGVMGVEIGIPPDADRQVVAAFARAAQGELPVILRLGLDQARPFAGTALENGASAVSLGAPRGVLTGPSGELVQGRLYGPAVYPLALGVVRSLAKDGLVVIAAGGVYTQQQADAMLAAGALGVQLDAVLWQGGYRWVTQTTRLGK